MRSLNRLPYWELIGDLSTMTITINTKPYNLDASVDVNQNQFTGPNHTLSTSDLLVLKRARSNPSVAAGHNGYARFTLKFQRNVTVNSVPLLMTGEASFSIPVGATEAEVDALRDDLGDLLISSNGDDAVWKLDINQ